VTDIHTIHTHLTQWHQHRQPYTFEGGMSSWDTYHTTEVPPLIQQLNEAEKPSAGDLTGTTFGSRPVVSIEAIDTLSHIDWEAAKWVRKLGHDDPGDTIACVTKVYSLAASAEFCRRDNGVIGEVEVPVQVAEDKWETRTRKEIICCDVHRIERDMRRWWTQARITSGWDSRAWAPNNTCPITECGERRTLRIRVDDQTAFCVNCRETWDSTSIGILAEHVRAENGEELTA
jgi:hypothetical protein